MRIADLIEQYARLMGEERDAASSRGLDAPIAVTAGQRMRASGTLQVYGFDLPADAYVAEDVPITLIPPAEGEPTEGFVVHREGRRVFLQTFEAIGETVSTSTLVADTSGYYETLTRRLHDLATRPEAYTLGPAERLLPWLGPHEAGLDDARRSTASASVLATNWGEDYATRRSQLCGQILPLVRANKRVLLISPDHRRADEVLGSLARAMRAVGMQYKSLLSRYELPVLTEAAGMPLLEFGFEAQVHAFFARSHANKASLRRKYERFRELTPQLAYKAEKQRDLNEVKLLEWRLLTQLSELQGNIKEINTTLAEYEAIPIWKRLAMQTVGKNVETLGEYRTLYEQQIQHLLGELELAKARIDELMPEAAIPKELRPEYDELKEEMTRLGGMKKTRELLAAEEGTNRQAFLQNRRVLVTTASRVLVDPIFTKVRFDILIAHEAPLIPAAYLVGAASLARERIVLSGDTRDLEAEGAWQDGGVAVIRRAFAPHLAAAEK